MPTALTIANQAGDALTIVCCAGHGPGMRHRHLTPLARHPKRFLACWLGLVPACALDSGPPNAPNVTQADPSALIAKRSPQLAATAGFEAPGSPGAPTYAAPRDDGTAVNPVPLPGASGVWTYTSVPGTSCRDGTTAGVATNLGSSDKLLIYLEGGGWCINEETCALNISNAGTFIDNLGDLWASGGIFDRDNPENPVRDWDFIYVPYCTGDLHAGANPDAVVAGVGPQRFVGYQNLEQLLPLIAASFPRPSDVVLTGASAGGMAALYDSWLVQRAFPDNKVKTISDAGPLPSSAVAPECLQAQMRTLFRFDDTVLRDCGDGCPRPNNFLEDLTVHVARTHADRPVGLIESTGDSVVRTFYGQGAALCTYPLDFLNPGVTADAFRASLLELRARVAAFPSFGTLYTPDSSHTRIWLPPTGLTPDFYTERVPGIRTVDWFKRIVDGEDPGHFGP